MTPDSSPRCHLEDADGHRVYVGVGMFVSKRGKRNAYWRFFCRGNPPRLYPPDEIAFEVCPPKPASKVRKSTRNAAALPLCRRNRPRR